jgi:hypothetical protein
MSSTPARTARWEPTWQRLVASTVVLFLVILAFLVGRVRAGADPGLAGAASQASQPQAQASQQPAQQGDRFGNAVPRDGGGAVPGQADGGSFGSPGSDPPSTHVS